MPKAVKSSKSSSGIAGSTADPLKEASASRKVAKGKGRKTNKDTARKQPTSDDFKAARFLKDMEMNPNPPRLPRPYSAIPIEKEYESVSEGITFKYRGAMGVPLSGFSDFQPEFLDDGHSLVLQRKKEFPTGVNIHFKWNAYPSMYKIPVKTTTTACELVRLICHNLVSFVGTIAPVLECAEPEFSLGEGGKFQVDDLVLSSIQTWDDHNWFVQLMVLESSKEASKMISDANGQAQSIVDGHQEQQASTSKRRKPSNNAGEASTSTTTHKAPTRRRIEKQPSTSPFSVDPAQLPYSGTTTPILSPSHSLDSGPSSQGPSTPLEAPFSSLLYIPGSDRKERAEFEGKLIPAPHYYEAESVPLLPVKPVYPSHEYQEQVTPAVVEAHGFPATFPHMPYNDSFDLVPQHRGFPTQLMPNTTFVQDPMPVLQQPLVPQITQQQQLLERMMAVAARFVPQTQPPTPELPQVPIARFGADPLIAGEDFFVDPQYDLNTHHFHTNPQPEPQPQFQPQPEFVQPEFLPTADGFYGMGMDDAQAAAPNAIPFNQGFEVPHVQPEVYPNFAQPEDHPNFIQQEMYYPNALGPNLDFGDLLDQSPSAEPLPQPEPGPSMMDLLQDAVDWEPVNEVDGAFASGGVPVIDLGLGIGGGRGIPVNKLFGMGGMEMGEFGAGDALFGEGFSGEEVQAFDGVGFFDLDQQQVVTWQ